MDCLVFQVPRDPRACLACQVSQERGESLAPRDTLAEREKSERGVGLASWETGECEVPKVREDPQELKEKWLSFPKRGHPGILDLLEMLDSQEKKVIKAILGCQGEEGIQEDMDPLDFTEESRVEMDSRGFLDPQVLLAHLGREGSLVFQDFQVTRVSWVLQGPQDFQELLEREDLKETKVTLQVSLAHLVQRVSQVALDVQGILEHPERGACPVSQGPEDHQEGQDCLAPSGHQAVQVTEGCQGQWDIQEKWGILDQEATWGIQGRQVFRE